MCALDRALLISGGIFYGQSGGKFCGLFFSGSLGRVVFFGWSVVSGLPSPHCTLHPHR